MLFDPSVSNAPPALADVNLWVTPKGTQRATFDLHVTARRHDGHKCVDLPQCATGVVSNMPDDRRLFQQAALATIIAAMALAREVA